MHSLHSSTQSSAILSPTSELSGSIQLSRSVPLPCTVQSSESQSNLGHSVSIDSSMQSSDTTPIGVSSDFNASTSASSSKKDDEDKLLSIFTGEMTPKQISTIFQFSGNDFESSMECLIAGPTVESLLKFTSSKYATYQPVKVHVDEEEMWSDLVAFYKAPKPDSLLCQLKVSLVRQPAVDTGGVRRQVYTSVFQELSDNKHVKLFDGPLNYLRPRHSAEARSSGLFRMLGTMVGHAILQDGIGFPYFSPFCYWYIAVGEEEAFQHISLCDVGADAVHFISKVILLHELVWGQGTPIHCNRTKVLLLITSHHYHITGALFMRSSRS